MLFHSTALEDAGLKIVLVLGSLVLLAAAGEIGLRLGVEFFVPRFTRIDPVLGWAHYANVSHEKERQGHAYRLSYNNHGYRGADIELAKAAGVRRVVFLGDSFTDGADVDDAEVFTRRLQDSLHGTEVIDLGIYDYSTAQELITLEEVGLRFDPDLVVLVSISHDLLDNVKNFSFFGPAPRYVLDEHGALRLEDTRHPAAREAFLRTNLPVPAMAFLHQHSLLYYALNHYLYQPLIARRIVALREEQEAAAPPEYRNRLYMELVSRMQRVCEARGVRFAVVFAYPPGELQAGESPLATIIDDVIARGIRTFDLFDGLRQAQRAGDETLYYREDIHWNARGHGAVAGLLGPKIAEWLEGI